VQRGKLANRLISLSSKYDTLINDSSLTLVSSTSIRSRASGIESSIRQQNDHNAQVASIPDNRDDAVWRLNDMMLSPGHFDLRRKSRQLISLCLNVVLCLNVSLY
jgi:hypothetical protein